MIAWMTAPGPGQRLTRYTAPATPPPIETFLGDES